MSRLQIRGRGLALLAGAALLLVGLAGCGSRPVAVVNGTKITEAEFVERLRQEAGIPVLARLLEAQVVRDAFQKAGLVLTDADVNAAIEDRFGSQEAFQQAMAENNVKPEDYLEQVLKPELMLEKLATKDLQITEPDLQAWYEEHKALYDVPERVTFRQIVTTQKADAEKAVEALKAGGDFAAVLRQYSVDPTTRETGGLVKDVPVPMLEERAGKLAETLQKLEVGQHSAPINLDEIWLVVKLEQRTAGEKRTFEQVRSQVEKHLKRSKLSAEALRELRSRLRAEAKVEIIPAEFQSLAEEYHRAAMPAFGEEAAAPAEGQPPAELPPAASP